ncbi:MAG: AMP-binding protein, partial [Bacteroidota bacterium]
MLAMLREETTFAKADLSSLFYFIVGGESMPIALIEAWHQKGIAIRQGYGMTEVGPNLTSLHQKDAIRKKGSIGFPNFYLETSIQDKEGQEVANGAAGELCLRGAVVSPGYWNRPEATAKSWRNGWFRTGDRVRKDEEGYLYVVDRIKNMYISGGENVYPAEVEKVLCSHPSVAEAIVVGIPHPKWGETGKAFIVSTDQTTDQDKLICYCKKYLAKFKIPTQFQFLSKLPKHDTGKIDRKKLKSSY